MENKENGELSFLASTISSAIGLNTNIRLSSS